MNKSKKRYGASGSIYKDLFMKMKTSKGDDILEMFNEKHDIDKSSASIIEQTTEDFIEPGGEHITENFIEPIKEKRTRNAGKRKLKKTCPSKNAKLLDIIDLSDECVNAENPIETPSSSKITREDSFNEEDQEYKVIVIWKICNKETFILRKYEKFSTIFEHFSKNEQLAPEKIYLFTLNNESILPSDSPDSLNFKEIEHIEGGVLHDGEANMNIQSQPVNKVLDADMLEFKLLLKNQKRPILIQMKKTQKMKTLMLKGAEEIKKPLDELKFFFDGDLINPMDSPEDLELEGGEVIEVKIM